MLSSVLIVGIGVLRIFTGLFVGRIVLSSVLTVGIGVLRNFGSLFGSLFVGRIVLSSVLAVGTGVRVLFRRNFGSLFGSLFVGRIVLSSVLAVGTGVRRNFGSLFGSFFGSFLGCRFVIVIFDFTFGIRVLFLVTARFGRRVAADINDGLTFTFGFGFDFNLDFNFFITAPLPFFFPLQKLLRPFLMHCNAFFNANSFAFAMAAAFNAATPPVFNIKPNFNPVLRSFPNLLLFFNSRSSGSILYIRPLPGQWIFFGHKMQLNVLLLFWQ